MWNGSGSRSCPIFCASGTEPRYNHNPLDPVDALKKISSTPMTRIPRSSAVACTRLPSRGSPHERSLSQIQCIIASGRNSYVYDPLMSDLTTLSFRLLHVFVAPYIARGADRWERHELEHDTTSLPTTFDLLPFVFIRTFIILYTVLYFVAFASLHVSHRRCTIVCSVPIRLPM